MYVWIHGGGNSVGSAAHISTYYGNRIASRSRVVFVSINYRLGPFGWFTLPAFRDGASAEDASGNFGTAGHHPVFEMDSPEYRKLRRRPEPGHRHRESRACGFDVLSLLISPPPGGFSSTSCRRAAQPSRMASTRPTHRPRTSWSACFSMTARRRLGMRPRRTPQA